MALSSRKLRRFPDRRTEAENILPARRIITKTEAPRMQRERMISFSGGICEGILIAIIIGHIYIGTIGMEGALDAMTTGNVDKNWVREHHSLWLEKIEGKSESHRHMHPAE